MPLTSGDHLSHYEITTLLGKGGMGEVYRARDTKLDRDVAIKVLPADFAEHADRMARFEREAKSLAALNHPNIATLFGFEEHDGTHFLVMELVEGEDLADRIQRGPIPVGEAIPLFVQIAEGLEAAHEKGIIHRDLKPANIKVGTDGRVKILDFGLAKAMEQETRGASAVDLSQSPTMTAAATVRGEILGTAAYMSPEQARGESVDRRTDIWAFGCCLYEAMTSHRVFQAATSAETLAKVLETSPEFDELSGRTAPQLGRILKRCLHREPRRRYHSIVDASLDLEEALAANASGSQSANSTRLGKVLLATALVGLVGFAVGWLVHAAAAPDNPLSEPVRKLRLELDEDVRIGSAPFQALTISPDGTRIAYVAGSRLRLRHLDQLSARVLPGTEGARNPFFSPDNEWIGFSQGFQAKKISTTGGTPIAISEQILSEIRSTTWGDDGTAIFSQIDYGIVSVDLDTGHSDLVLSVPLLGDSGGVVGSLQMLPSKKAILFAKRPSNTNWDDAQVLIYEMDSGRLRTFLERGRAATYLETGHVVYVVGQTLFGVAFDPETYERGAPVPLIDGLAIEPASGSVQYSVSDAGTLVYGETRATELGRKMVWVDRSSGQVTPLPVPTRGFQYPRLSPDDTAIAVTIRESSVDIYVHDLDTGNPSNLSPLSTGAAEAESPLWLDDQILMWATDRDRRATVRQPADGSGQQELIDLGAIPHHHLGAWSQERQLLAYTSDKFQIWQADLSELPSSPQLLVPPGDLSLAPTFSPDGRRFAYATFRQGHSEIVVDWLDGEGGRTFISGEAGGTEPFWSRDGTEIFFRGPEHMMSVELDGEDGFLRPVPLFPDQYSRIPWSERNYDVSKDGTRFLMVKDGEGAEVASLVMIENWFEELQRLVPTL